MRYIVCPEIKKSRISPEIYGHFSEHLGRCIYGGLFVGKNSDIPNVNGMRADVVEALKKMRIPVLRWPGGCFADEYHWKDGVGPLKTRKRMYNSNWGGVVEDNSFGTHEFFELCRQLGCEAYVNGNVGSGTVQEMQEWVEYITSPAVSPMADLRRANGQEAPWRMKYFGVGNENWGCGGCMRPEYYADEFRRYQTYVRNYGDEKIFKIACGPGTSVEAPGYEWTRVLMERAGRHMDGLSLHFYTSSGPDWEHKGSATDFDTEVYLKTVANASFMETLVKNHGGIMDIYDPEKRVGLMVDEWGTWFETEPGTNPHFLFQQNTMRDAIVAAETLNIFNRHSDRVRMANIAQTVNVLQSVILTDGAKMALTPTYHVFEMFKEHQGATLVSAALDSPVFENSGLTVPWVSESASVTAEGDVIITLANLDPENARALEMRIDGGDYRIVSARTLTGDMHAHNDFDAPDTVRPVETPAPAARFDGAGSEFTLSLPPCSVVALRARRA